LIAYSAEELLPILPATVAAAAAFFFEGLVNPTKTFFIIWFEDIIIFTVYPMLKP
jgi:hypothetical protein